MTLKEIREHFIELSGRRDLVTDVDSYGNDGADKFIQWGQKFLDNQVSFPKDTLRVEKTLSDGERTLQLADVRAIKFVFRHDTEGQVPLQKLTYDRYWDRYGTKTEKGEPSHWAHGLGRSQNSPSSDTESGDEIVVWPLSNGETTLSVIGKFFSAGLNADDDVSFWSLEYPETLIQAAMYQLERFYRNTSGMRDHLNAIQQDLRGIDHNVAEQEAGMIDQMKDSW
jgi:hypothetical protein